MRKALLTDDEKTFYTELGRLMTTYRNKLGLRQQDLARALGVTFQQIQKYEAAANRIPAYVLHRMAQLYGVSFANVIGADIAKCDYRLLSADQVTTALNNIMHDVNQIAKMLKLEKVKAVPI